MKDRFFLDMNVIIYSFDVTAIDKAQRARQLIGEVLDNNNGCIGTPSNSSISQCSHTEI